MMTKTERITYTELALQIELERLGQVCFYPEETWTDDFLANPGVDPLGVHKQFGLVVPQLIKDTWTMGVSAPHIIKPMQEYDDAALDIWIQYWLAHTGLHVWASYQGLPSLQAIETQVDEELEVQGPEVFAFGKRIQLLST